jgi:2-amino-4-hydroxy-6-hydroxymethyldihydropteridine diphosphokinase
MPMITAYIAVGANLGDRQGNVDKAFALLNRKVGKIVAQSSFEDFKPYLPEHPQDLQPYYLNGVVAVETELSAQRLLTHLLAIEAELGRVRTPHNKWAARTIDLDLIAYGDQVIQEKNLMVPHPEMHLRDFVLLPMAQIAPEWVHPTIQKTIRELVGQL